MQIALKSLKLKNFRGYTDITINFDEQMNIIVGRNDVGKSTILEALEIFFNNEQIKITKEDRNICCSNDEKIEISCCFSIAVNAITIIDSTIPINMADEYLLNENGLLEILKIYDCSKSSIGSKDIKTYIVANYPQISETPLVCEKIAKLKTILKDTVKPEIYDETYKSTSSQIRKAIYTELINKDTAFSKTFIDVTQESAKNIWSELQKSLPLFFLFKSDRLNSDKDTEVQAPLKAITKSVVAGMEEELQKITDEVKEKVTQIGQETIKKLSEFDSKIASALIPNVSVKSLDSLFSFDLISDDGVPLNKRGSGVRRLILLSYFRAESEKKVQSAHNNSIIYAIEEPETAQHPDFQKMIIESLLELSTDGNHQIIVTTHTPEIVKMVQLNHLIFLYKNEQNLPCIENQDEIKYDKIANTLGILPFAVEQCVICVEGENDINFLTTINQIPEFKSIIDLNSENIKIIPLHGSNLITWVNSNYFKESNIKEIHIYDNDRQDYRDTARKIQLENDGRRFAFLTQRREMENYIPPKLIEEKYHIDLSNKYDEWSSIDVSQLLVNKILSEIPDIKEREKQIKNTLNKKLSKKITAESLKEINAFDELFYLFTEIRKIKNGI